MQRIRSSKWCEAHMSCGIEMGSFVRDGIGSLRFTDLDVPKSGFRFSYLVHSRLGGVRLFCEEVIWRW